MNSDRLHQIYKRLCQYFLLIFLAVYISQSVASDEKISSLEDFLAVPVENFEINYRVTSKMADAMPVVAHVNIRGVDKDKHREYLFEIDYPGGKQRYCMTCEAGYVLNSCKSSELSLPDLKEGVVKGTFLPWGELTDGLCMSWSIKDLPRGANTQQTLVEIRPKKKIPRIHWDYTRAYLDENGFPVHLERVSAEGRILRKIRILEIRKLFSRIGVRRALVEYGSTRVLLEARSMQLLDSDEDTSF